MRLRNIPRADGVLNECKEVVKNEKEYRGRWHEVFGNSNPIHIEIGMGKGQFLLTLAGRNPGINYIGIERYSSVLLRAVEKFQAPIPMSGSAGTALPGVATLPNIRFICMDARDIADTFAPGEVDRIYLNFSDPWPKDRHAKRRLTSPDFMRVYDKILRKDGTVEFKTDNQDLFTYSLASIPEAGWRVESFTRDLHHSAMAEGNVMTEYEMRFSAAGNPICKLIASRQSSCAG